MKRTIVDQIEITSDGHIGVRMKKQIVDGDDVIDVGYHRTFIPCGCDCDMQMCAVNEHLISMRAGAVSVDDIEQIKLYANVAFTDKRIADYQKKLQEQAKGE